MKARLTILILALCFLICACERREIPMDTTAAAAAPAETQTEPSAQAASLPVNINTADAAELAALPGIGKVLAQRILDYRRVHGDFSAVEQLTNVEGIGEGKLESILELITIGG